MSLMKVILKGQLSSKCIFGVFNSPKKQRKHRSHSSKVKFFVRFFGELKIPKRRFEINWPLAGLSGQGQATLGLVQLQAFWLDKGFELIRHIITNMSFVHYWAYFLKQMMSSSDNFTNFETTNLLNFSWNWVCLIFLSMYCQRK